MMGKHLFAWLLFLASVRASGSDTVFFDGFENEPDCHGGLLGAALNPAHAPIRLGESARYVLSVRSCGYTGNLQLAAAGAPNGWSIAFDPASPAITPAALAFVDVTVTVASDAEAGTLDVPVTASGGGQTANASSSLVVNNEFVIPIAAGTGSGDHHFPAQLALRVGTLLRFVDDDASAPHRIHFLGSIPGMSHQASDMQAGQEYDVTASAPGTDNDVYCHDHGNSNGVMHLTVHQ